MTKDRLTLNKTFGLTLILTNELLHFIALSTSSDIISTIFGSKKTEPHLHLEALEAAFSFSQFFNSSLLSLLKVQ